MLWMLLYCLALRSWIGESTKDIVLVLSWNCVTQSNHHWQYNVAECFAQSSLKTGTEDWVGRVEFSKFVDYSIRVAKDSNHKRTIIEDTEKCLLMISQQRVTRLGRSKCGSKSSSFLSSYRVYCLLPHNCWSVWHSFFYFECWPVKGLFCQTVNGQNISG